MEHYYFTRDKVYLKNKAYPILKANVEFLLDWLVNDPRTGKLVSGPSASPENGFYPDPKNKQFMAHACMGPAIDQEIIAESFIDFLAASKELGIEDGMTRQVRESLKQLATSQVAPDGRLMEWDRDYKGYEDGHRHFSHIYGAYPGCAITPETTALFEAARKSVTFRLDHGGAKHGWSLAWLVNIQARFLEGETPASLFSTCSNTTPFVI
jgi:alpha-L-fucosidase 2